MTAKITSLTYLEFYSGIGGWGYALEHACRSINNKNKNDGNDGSILLQPLLLAAYDHSDLCNSVLLHNHKFPNMSSSSISENINNKKRKKQSLASQTPIEKLTLQTLSSLNANIWCMSPPCQPHTRQHTNQMNEMNDSRSKSFIHLCDMLSEMDDNSLPQIIMLENVVGFEKSWKHHGSFQTFRNVLHKRNYQVIHIHLDPTHVGIPNNRPRHYTCAILQRREEEKGRNGRYDHLFCKEILNQAPIIHDESSLLAIKTSTCTKLSSFLDKDIPPNHTSSSSSKVSQQKCQELQIPTKIQTSSSAWCFDIATTTNDNDECITSCFTHSYGKFIRGTGSILYTGPTSSSPEGNGDGDGGDNTVQFKLLPPEERTYDESWSKGINWDYMRYFSGTEVARLMGFPVDDNVESADDKKKNSQTEEEEEGYRKFSFPSEVTMKQQWKLLGNSLNVRVAAAVAEMGIDSVYS